jgi:hypothetical protein
MLYLHLINDGGALDAITEPKPSSMGMGVWGKGGFFKKFGGIITYLL